MGKILEKGRVVHGIVEDFRVPASRKSGRAARFSDRDRCDNVALRQRSQFPMSLSDQDVTRIAHLARLAITPAELAAWGSSLSRILELIERMNAVDTADVAPMSHPQDAALRLRADSVSETDLRDKFQAIAPAVEAGLYLVPKVIE